jgi:3-hydroxybutyryl-CoA dehydratase
MARAVGEVAEFTKTVSETDVYLYAGLTGDMAPNHINEPYMKKSKWGRRQAHGAMMVGFMSTAVSELVKRHRGGKETPVSLGYDRIRFLAPVFFGDTVTTTYRILEVDEDRKRITGALEVKNQDDVLVAVGTHIEKWVSNRE